MSDEAPQIFFDVTTMTHAGGRAAGASRVESRFGRALHLAHRSAIRPVTWSARTDNLMLAPDTVFDDYIDGLARPHDECAPLPSASDCPHSRRRVLLETGSGWLSNASCLRALIRARETLQAELHVVLHDLVHVLFPHWSTRDEAARLGSHLEMMITSADRLLVYSDSTANDLKQLARERRWHLPDIQRIALGVEFAEGATAHAPSADLMAVAATPFVLYVSTIAFRKNHAFLCDVWARLAAELGPALPRLVLAGNVASDMELVMERVRRNPALRDHLLLVDGSSDGDLAWLYSRCAFTVYPSLYEGWGLPVQESLGFGKVCLASNASAVPEAAAGVTPVIDPQDVPAWSDAIRQLLDPCARATAERRIREGYRPTTWREAADRLWAAVTPPLGVARAAASSGGAADVVTEESWQNVRTRLGRVAARRTRVGLRIDDVPPNGVRLQYGVVNRRSEAARVEVEVNGAVSDGFDVTGSAARSLDVPRDVLRRRALVEVVVLAKSASEEAVSLCDDAVVLGDFSLTPLTPEEESAALERRLVYWRMGDTYPFSTAARGLAMLQQGWGEAAHWGVWTVEPTARITFRPMPQPSEDIVFRVATRAFVWPSHPSFEVDVVCGGRVLRTWAFQHPVDVGIVERSVVIPTDAIEDGLVDLQLSIPRCRSPRELSMSDDERRLGLGFARACIVPNSSPADPGWLRRRHSIAQLF